MSVISLHSLVLLFLGTVSCAYLLQQVDEDRMSVETLAMILISVLNGIFYYYFTKTDSKHNTTSSSSFSLPSKEDLQSLSISDHFFLPPLFSQTDIPLIHQFIEEHPLATLMLVPSHKEVHSFPVVAQIPLFIVDSPTTTDPHAFVLRGHLSKKNPIYQEMKQQILLLANSNTTPQVPICLLFQGHDTYISPSWYPSKQRVQGKMVPTWNYSSVLIHSTGQLFDAHLEESKPQVTATLAKEHKQKLLRILDALSQIHENNLYQQTQSMQPPPTCPISSATTHTEEKEVHKRWLLSEAPEEYVEQELQHIVGIEFQIINLQCKAKLSQNRNPVDKKNVYTKLKQFGKDEVADDMTKWGNLKL